MTLTYNTTGIILKKMHLGENDRLVTILTPDNGLVRAVAPGARKHKSNLRGRCELFVVNQLQIIGGRNLDKIIQAETTYSYPKLSRDLAKLAAAQYLAEIVLRLAVAEEPQGELYQLLLEHLRRIEALENNRQIYAHLAQAAFHLLAVGGIAPQTHLCCWSQTEVEADFEQSDWHTGFSFAAGGVVSLPLPEVNHLLGADKLKIDSKLDATELWLLQHLGYGSLPEFKQLKLTNLDWAWLKLEHLLRNYLEYQLDCFVRSATLIDSLDLVAF